MFTTRRPVHPGRIIKQKLVKWQGRANIARFAAILGVSRPSLSRVMSGRAPVNADLAIRLSEVFDDTARSWMNKQTTYDLWHARKSRRKRSKKSTTFAGAFHITGRFRLVPHA
jgi:addiction module HigA family antidote